MFNPQQQYDIAQLRHQEFVAQAQRDRLAAQYCEGRRDLPRRHWYSLADWLRTLGAMKPFNSF